MSSVGGNHRWAMEDGAHGRDRERRKKRKAEKIRRKEWWGHTGEISQVRGRVSRGGCGGCDTPIPQGNTSFSLY